MLRLQKEKLHVQFKMIFSTDLKIDQCYLNVQDNNVKDLLLLLKIRQALFINVS